LAFAPAEIIAAIRAAGPEARRRYFNSPKC
jgi:hypothetical protein